jgi:DNA-binding SARP family transcriptional activator/tetratricopeptide (TPR) repeat protein
MAVLADTLTLVPVDPRDPQVGAPMRYRILGPIECECDGRPVDLGGPRRRALLAMLLVHANQVVSAGRLVDALWGETPPASAGKRVQALVSELRLALRDAGVNADLVITRPPGYLLTVATDELDLAQFDEQVRLGRQAAACGQPAEADRRFRAALAMWRGPALSGVCGPFAEQTEARLAEARLAVIEECTDVNLRLARHHELVAELTALVAEHPHRNTSRSQLMLALHRSGRTPDALEVYRAGVRYLADEFGLDPTPELQRLHVAILAGDPDLDRTPLPAAQSSAPQPPALLPSAPRDFTGRQDVVTTLCQLFGSGAVPVARIAAVSGKAGVGKTAVALYVANRVRAAYPDGQLYVDLRGVEPRPLAPSVVLAWFLRSLGVDPAVIPSSVEERGALYRSILSSRRVLVVLDNAASEAQVRPLLPGTGTCTALVTSRMPLAALEGAHHEVLDTLGPEQALGLLAGVAGDAKVRADRRAAEQVVELCGRLPLAVRIAGARLAARPHWSIANLLAVLGDERRRLDELAIGDLEVRGSIASSYEGLKPAQRQAFRLLGLHDGVDFAPWLAALLWDLPAGRAESTLDELVDARLVDVSTTGRYRLHDLVRLFARERTEAEDTTQARLAATTRLLDGYVTLAALSEERLVDVRVVRLPRVPLDRAPAAEIGEVTARPIPWLESERLNLVHAVDRAAELGLAEHAWTLASCLESFFRLRGYPDDYDHTHAVALAAAEAAGDALGVGMMLIGQSYLRAWQDRYTESEELHRLACDAIRPLDDPYAAAEAAMQEGVVHDCLGRLPQALAAYERSLALALRIDEPACALAAQCRIGAVHLQLGQRDEAERALSAAMALGAGADDTNSVGRLGWLGRVRRCLAKLAQQRQQPVEAIAHFRAALVLFERVGHPWFTPIVRTELGELYLRTGDVAAASELIRYAHGEFRGLADRSGRAMSLRALADLHRAEGRHGLAVACAHESMRVCRAIGDRLGIGRARFSLGQTQLAEGHRAQGLKTLRSARRVLARSGFAEADSVAAVLARLPERRARVVRRRP